MQKIINKDVVKYTSLFLSILLFVLVVVCCRGRNSSIKQENSNNEKSIFYVNTYKQIFTGDLNDDSIADSIVFFSCNKSIGIRIIESSGKVFKITAINMGVFNTEEFGTVIGTRNVVVDSIKKHSFCLINREDGNNFNTTVYQFIKKENNWYLEFASKESGNSPSKTLLYNCSTKLHVPFERFSWDSSYFDKKDEIILDPGMSVSTIFNQVKRIQENAYYKNFPSDFSFTLLDTYPLNYKNVGLINEIAYYLSERGQKETSAVLLSEIVDKFSDRVVAYLNLADAYWALNKQEEAKKNYQKYVELMKTQKKDLSRIPKRVYERIR